MGAEISYGKAQVPMYRTYAREMSKLRRVPESDFQGRKNILFGVEVDVEVFGDNFMPAYTHGDNSNVVATDTMKNFILRQGLIYNGTTIEASSISWGLSSSLHILRCTVCASPAGSSLLTRFPCRVKLVANRPRVKCYSVDCTVAMLMRCWRWSAQRVVCR